MLTHLYFDFFGTLVDYSASRTEQGYEASHAVLRSGGGRLDYASFLALWSDVSRRFDAESERSGREFSMHALAAAFLREAVGAPASDALVDEFVTTYLREWNTGVRYLDGLDALLERLGRRHALGLITNTHHAPLVLDHLSAMGVSDRFAVVVTSIEHGDRKPRPGIFRDALGRLDAAPADSAYVGDSFEADYVGARGVGMQPYLIDPKRRAAIDERHRLQSLWQLEDRLPA